MAWLQYFKGEPTEYILAYSNGNVFRQGAGKAFWYLKHNTSIVLVPASTTDALFVLNEATGNFQAVTLQGQITYRIAQPQTIAGLLNFTIDPRTRQYLSDDPEKLNQRIVNIVQTLTRKELAGLSLEAALGSAEAMGRAVLAQMQQEPALAAMGVECLSLFYTSIKATPEMTKALEAEYREALQKRADQAIYARRADAVEQERKIKQNELSTSIDLEKRRQELVDLQGENARKQAEFEAEATRIKFGPYLNMDARLLTALAFRDFAGNSQKIGNLTITSEILEQLLNGPASNGK
ncbi:MAG TPA: SPFH domain-containing protein [Ktedonobacterales bacterium]|nr:SPFH domain-containing protein [Ktedonobacterales bacterium]